jgi:hypothetical protein
MTFIQAISAIPAHIHALLLILLGAMIALFGQKLNPDAVQLGSSLVAAGLALYRMPDDAPKT